MADNPTESTAVVPDGRTGYRAHLDGLRTVAVYLVVAFHAGLASFRGGFIGVDIFFVLSGFLVTGILVRDLTSRGQIDWRRFYSRRVRRIVPAALIALLVTAFVYSVVATPVEVLDAVGGVRAAFLFVANWYFIHQATDYFAANVNTNPVLHFWSLAVEEQFYLLWPLALGGLYVACGRLGTRRWSVMRIVVVAVAVASALEALHLGATNLARAYYGTDTRAYQLLAGAALALTPQLFRFGVGRRARGIAQAVAALALCGLFVLASSTFVFSAITRGVLVAVTASVLIVALENACGGLAIRALSWEPMTYLGRISYGTYLWHWPVIVILTHGGHHSSLEVFAVACLLATGLAALSFHFLEHPVRVSRTLDRYKTQVVAIGFATSILIGVLVVPSILDAGGSGTRSGSSLLDWRVAKFDRPSIPDCVGHPVQRCTVVRGTGAHVLLLGDSTARMWVPTLKAIARRHSLTFSVAVQDGCPWQLGLYYPNSHPECKSERADWYARIVPQLHPDVVILVDRAIDDPIRDFQYAIPDQHTTPATYERAIDNATAQSIHMLSAPRRKIVVFEPTPLDAWPSDPLSCLSTGREPSRCGYETHRGPTPYEQYLRTMPGRPNIMSVDLDRLACPRLPHCDAIVGNIIVQRDFEHLTGTYARSLATPLFVILHRQHIL